MFHKDKGQKLKVNLLVGEPKPSYNSFIDFKVEKEPKSKSMILLKQKMRIFTLQNCKQIQALHKMLQK